MDESEVAVETGACGGGWVALDWLVVGADVLGGKEDGPGIKSQVGYVT